MPEEVALPDPTDAVLAQYASVLNLVLRVRDGVDGALYDLLCSSHPVDSAKRACACVADNMCDVGVSAQDYLRISLRRIELERTCLR